MKLIEAYQTSDGHIFTDEQKAELHQKDIIGQLLDDFLPHDDRGNVTQADRHNILMRQLHDPKLKAKIVALYEAVMFSD